MGKEEAGHNILKNEIDQGYNVNLLKLYISTKYKELVNENKIH